MAAYAALVSLLNNIHTITNHPHLSTSLHNKQIQPLLEKIYFLLHFVEGNNYGGGSKEGQDLERKIASAAHAAEDLIESHIVDRIHEENLRWPYLLMSFLKSVVSDISEKSLDLQKITEEMDAIMKEAKDFKERHQFGVEKQQREVAEPLLHSGERAMVGLDAELTQLLDELTGCQSIRRIISIVGMAGTGKTTLAKSLHENLLIKEQFQFRAWATISEQNNAREILSKLLSGLGKFGNGTIYDLGLQLHKILSGRRYLIILDGMRSVKAWNEVKRFFPNSENKSRIVLTTRLSNVAKDCGSSLFMMNLLDEEKSWKLFCDKALRDEHCPPELLEVGKEIVRLCKGLALSIVVIGGLLLKSPRSVEYWKNVAKNLKSIPDSKEKQENLDVLSLSYKYLPPHLKPCFLYMGVFKENSKIHVSKIVELWVAEGFIQPIGSRVLEEIAEGYLKDLIDRNLILVGKRNKNGKVGSCGIHDLLRNLCIKVAEQNEFFHESKGGIRGTERRLVDNWYVERIGVVNPLVRSVMARRPIVQPSEYRLLRVLDEVYSNPQADYYGNVNLRYLAYHHLEASNRVWKLPTSVSLLWNLQTLVIEQASKSLMIAPTDVPTFVIEQASKSLMIAPTEFWKMRQLRHVKSHLIYLPPLPPSNGQDGLSVLPNLQTLKTVVNLRLCEEACKIIPNIKKLHLVYDHDSQGFDNSLIECLCNLDRLQRLESLNLVTLSGTRWFPNRELKRKLTTSFPKSLKKLSLSRIKFEWEDMTNIGLLPLLEVLELEIYSGWGDEWSPVNDQFLRLKFLKIQDCTLARWDVHEYHFPVLEKLLLVNLWALGEIPLDIGDIPTLELIHVEHCGLSAAISAVKMKRENVGNEGLQVRVLVHDKFTKCFNQMLDAEGLTTDNIQLGGCNKIED